MSHLYERATTWEDFVRQVHGPSYLSPNLDALDHPAKELLTSYRDHGVPVVVNAPSW